MRQLIAGNWKMHTIGREALALARQHLLHLHDGQRRQQPPRQLGIAGQRRNIGEHRVLRGARRRQYQQQKEGEARFHAGRMLRGGLGLK